MKTKILTTIKTFVLAIVILTSTVVSNHIAQNYIIAEAATKIPKINTKSAKLKVGETYNIKIKNPGKNKWKWTSTNKKVATVDKNGVVTAKSRGVTYINVSCKNYFLSCKVLVKSAFDKNEAKSKITFTPIGADNTFYKVTSTYEMPAYVTANYKIVDKDGVTISKSSTGVLATPWRDSYIKIPFIRNDQTVQLSYSYSDRSLISKDKYDNLLNSIQITKFENITGNSFLGHGNTGSFMYNVYIKNTSSKKVSGSIGFLVYDDNGELLPYQANSQAYINLDPDETVKQTIEVLQEVKNKDHHFDGIENVGDIKFYISNL